jgi:sulfur carrier protein ThiS
LKIETKYLPKNKFQKNNIKSFKKIKIIKILYWVVNYKFTFFNIFYQNVFQYFKIYFKKLIKIILKKINFKPAGHIIAVNGSVAGTNKAHQCWCFTHSTTLQRHRGEAQGRAWARGRWRNGEAEALNSKERK